MRSASHDCWGLDVDGRWSIFGLGCNCGLVGWLVGIGSSREWLSLECEASVDEIANIFIVECVSHYAVSDKDWEETANRMSTGPVLIEHGKLYCSARSLEWCRFIVSSTEDYPDTRV